MREKVIFKRNCCSRQKPSGDRMAFFIAFFRCEKERKRIMWSLPDIRNLNERAAQNATKLSRAAERKRKPNCEYYNCTRRADHSFLWFDIFSDDPKGIIHLCEQHVGYS